MAESVKTTTTSFKIEARIERTCMLLGDGDISINDPVDLIIRDVDEYLIIARYRLLRKEAREKKAQEALKASTEAK